MTSIFWFVLACTTTEINNTPRELYNQGTEALNSDQYEEATTLLLSARDQAGSDQQLRQQAAYNLALSHALMGAATEEADPQKASEEYSQAASWFQDAVRMNPDDEDARINLEVVLKRLQLLADQLNAGTNGLQARLDRLLDDTRTLRDNVRSLSNQIEGSGDSKDPSGYRSQFDSLAVQVRTLQAEASTTLQLSGDELSNLENKLEEERTEEEQMRLIQLTYLDYHLAMGRDNIADSRRVLRRLDIEQSLDRLEKTVRNLKRAREQLLDPVTVLQSIAQEEQQLLQQSLMLLGSQQPSADETEIPSLPQWFNNSLLANNQEHLHSRSKEILQRFEFNTSTSPPEDLPSEQQDMFTLMQDAIPPLTLAVESMKQATEQLNSNTLSTASETEQQALLHLTQAIERFADIKNLIELAYTTQQGLHSLILPLEEQNAILQELSEEERVDLLEQSLTENISRVDRMKIALTLEKKKRLQQLQAAAQGNPPDDDAISETEALFEEAERLRSETYSSLLAMNQAAQEDGVLLEPSQSALTSLSELRILFFSIVEHLKDTLERQQNLMDQSSEAASDDYERMLEQMTFLIPEQQGLSEKTTAISEVLQQQADTTAAQGANDQAEAFSTAYAETVLALQYMEDVISQMERVQTEEGGMSHELDPAMEAQQGAIEALAAAIQALQPPQQDQGDEQQENQDQQLSKQQAERRLQAAKEREAERAAKPPQGSAADPVEKDW